MLEFEHRTVIGVSSAVGGRAVKGLIPLREAAFRGCAVGSAFKAIKLLFRAGGSNAENRAVVAQAAVARRAVEGAV